MTATGVEKVALAPSQGHERPRGATRRDAGGSYDDPAVQTLTFRPLSVLLFIAHDRRELVDT